MRLFVIRKHLQRFIKSTLRNIVALDTQLTQRIFQIFTVNKKTISTSREKETHDLHEKIIFIISLFAQVKVSVKRFASFDSLIGVMDLNSQTWRTAWKKAKHEERNSARVSATLTYVYTYGSHGARRKGSKKLWAVLERSNV